MLMSALYVCAALFAFFFFGWTKIIPGGLTTVHFYHHAGIGSGILGWPMRLIKKVEFINYQNCLIVVQIVSLVVLYATGGNYIILS